MLSVIIPANNEVGYIEPCLEALLAQTYRGPVEVIIAANGCSDDTVGVSRGYADRFAALGYTLIVLDIAEGSKPNALNLADQAAQPGSMRAYLDADVILSPEVLAQLVEALDVPRPRYASGALQVSRAETWVTRRFATIWTRLPFMAEGSVPGAGLFAVNGAGRTRWDVFPKIISDDTYVRLQFTPEERIGVAAPYDWPMIEGFKGLVKVRRRQDKGVEEIAALWPELMQREGKARLGLGGLLRLALGHPVSFAVYVAVLLTVRYGPRQDAGWSRGR